MTCLLRYPTSPRIGRTAFYYAAGLIGLCVVAIDPVAAEPSMVLLNAKVFTANPAQPFAQAVAIEAGRILAVGSDEQIRALAGSATRIVDAGGRLLTPGLIEAHVHLGPPLPSSPLPMPNLPFPGPTAEELLSGVEQAAKAGGGWVSAFIGLQLARDQRNWRLALDAVAPSTPVMLRAPWGHVSIVNSEGLRRLGIAEDVADPLGGWWGRDAQGRLDGSVYEHAQTLNIQARPHGPGLLAAVFSEAAKRYAQWGVTSIHLMNNDKSLQATVEGLTLAKSTLKWTVYSWATPVQQIPDAWSAIQAGPKQLPSKVRIEGPKWMFDGTPLEQNSFQREPHPGRPGWFGRSNFTQTQIESILRLALNSPTQLSLHVVGGAELDRFAEDDGPARACVGLA